MAQVIGQRWEVLNYVARKNVIPKKGEAVVVKNTPDFGDSIIMLIADGTKSIQLRALIMQSPRKPVRETQPSPRKRRQEKGGLLVNEKH